MKNVLTFFLAKLRNEYLDKSEEKLQKSIKVLHINNFSFATSGTSKSKIIKMPANAKP